MANVRVDKLLSDLHHLREQTAESKSSREQTDLHLYEVAHATATIASIGEEVSNDPKIDEGEKGAVIGKLHEARQSLRTLDRLIDTNIESSEWCNCEFFDDIYTDPVELEAIQSFVADSHNWETLDESRCVIAKWDDPPRISLDAATLNRVRWRIWRKQFVAACVNTTFEVSRGTAGAQKASAASPYLREPPDAHSHSAIAVFNRLRPYVYLSAKNGAIYFRSFIDGEVRSRRILTTESDKRAVFAKYWNDPALCSHRGRTTTHKRFLDTFLGFSRLEVDQFIRETELYQVSSKHKVIPKIVQPLVTSRPMEHLQMDLVDMQPFTKFNDKFTFMLVLVDCFSKFCWAQPILNKEALTIREALMRIFYVEGFPTILQSDNGPEFTGKGNPAFFQSKGMIFRTGRAYKPSTQGQVERTNKTLKQAVYMDFLASEDYNWVEGMPARTYAYNTLVQSAIHKTPYEIHRGFAPPFAPEFRDVRDAQMLKSAVGAEMAAPEFLQEYMEKHYGQPQGTNERGEAPSYELTILSDERLLMELREQNVSINKLLPMLTVSAGVTGVRGEQEQTEGAYSLARPSHTILSAGPNPVLEVPSRTERDSATQETEETQETQEPETVTPAGVCPPGEVWSSARRTCKRFQKPLIGEANEYAQYNPETAFRGIRFHEDEAKNAKAYETIMTTDFDTWDEAGRMLEIGPTSEAMQAVMMEVAAHRGLNVPVRQSKSKRKRTLEDEEDTLSQASTARAH